MALDLSRIPGAAAPSRQPSLFRRRRGGRRPVLDDGYRTSSLRDPRAAIGAKRGTVLYRPKRRLPIGDVLIGLAFVAVAVFLGWKGWEATRVPVEIAGIDDGAALRLDAATDLEVVVTIDRADSVAGASFTVNDEAPPGDVLERTDTGFVWTPGPLPADAYRIEVHAPRPVLSDAAFSWEFVVDDTAPLLEIPEPAPAGICEPVTVTARAEPGSTVTVGGEPVDLADDGTFTLSFDQPPAGAIPVIATDAAGNRSGGEIVVPTDYPPNQGVHVTAAAWGHDGLRQGILDLIDAGLVSTVELDLKDEGGIVGYDTDVALAHTIGAVQEHYDLDEAMAELEARDVRVVGRVVAFRDAPLAHWAWNHGRPDMVVQDAEGGMLGAYGGFTNFVHPDVRQYNLDIALEGVEAGMDDILWDYVRRPEGAISNMVFPGIEGSVASEVAEFLAFTAEPLRERCAYQGASLFGIAADRPWAVGQDVGLIARNVDYIAPMLYPSHWGPGEYGVDHPDGQPYDIIKASLADFQAKAEGTGVTMVPWIQDFSLGVAYGPEEVRAQIEAARDLGVDDWLLWNARVVYTEGALDPSLVAAPVD